MKKKILSMCLVVVLLAIAIVGGTLAYFTDTEQVDNTMVIGNVEINIEELAYTDTDGDGNPDWHSFEDDEFVLYPIVDEKGILSYNKMVYTFNTSKSEDDAYIRTIVLFECNDDIPDGTTSIHYDFDTSSSKVVEAVKKVEIGGEMYNVVVFVAANEQPIAVDESLKTLTSVWMDKNVTSEQIAGWGDDGKVDIKVLSQGIQAEGLDHAAAMDALGEVDETNLQKWFSEATEGNVNDGPFADYN